MVSLLGALTRPRNDSPAPLVSRAASGRFPGGLFARRDAATQLGVMATNGTVFGIVNKTSTAVAKTEWHLYRKAKSGKDDDRVEVTSHAALDLINKPNDFMTRMELFETLQQHLDLAGEACLLVSRAGRIKLPLELWPIRPDRLDPVPHPTKYLTGWIYTSPDGEQVPLDVDEVIHVRMPNPLDPYRGLSPVASVLTDVVSADYARQWNANFFRNSAEPGGVIEIEKVLSDEEFDTLAARWDEQHRGVSRAHHVAILEAGMKWVDRNYSMRDMQFVELRGATRDAIMEAYGYPKSMSGITEDVNRANAESGEYVFAKWLTVPRDDRWRDTLNAKLLPLYGKDTPRTLEFDYDSPVPEDEAADNAERDSKARSAQMLVAAGFDGDSVKEALDLPEALVWEKPAAPVRPIVPGSDGPAPPEPGALEPPDAPEPAADPVAALLRNLVRASAPPAELNDAGWPTVDKDAVEAVNLHPVQAAWEAALAALLRLWQSTIVPDWINQLLDQIRTVLRGDGGTLADLKVDSHVAAGHIADAMGRFAEASAGHAVAEAAKYDVTLHPAWPTAHDLAAAAEEIAAFDAQRYAATAGREAARVRAPGVPDEEVFDHTRRQLAAMPEYGSSVLLGGALTDAQNQARARTLQSGPVGAIYASEVLDTATCQPCREIHGRWICNTDDLAALFKLYPTGGYIDCLGRERCRGTFVGVWRPKTTEGGQ